MRNDLWLSWNLFFFFSFDLCLIGLECGDLRIVLQFSILFPLFILVYNSLVILLGYIVLGYIVFTILTTIQLFSINYYYLYKQIPHSL